MDGIQGRALRRKSRGNPVGINKTLGCAFIPMGGPQAHDQLIGKVSQSVSASQSNPQVTLAWSEGCSRGTSGIPWFGGRIFALLVLGPASNRTVLVLPQMLML